MIEIAAENSISGVDIAKERDDRGSRNECTAGENSHSSKEDSLKASALALATVLTNKPELRHYDVRWRRRRVHVV